MGKVKALYVDMFELNQDEQVACIVCENRIPDDEFNSLDPKYQEDPVCEHCWSEGKSPLHND